MNDPYTPQEVSALLKGRVKPSTVMQMARDGRLARVPGVRAVLIPAWSVARLLEGYDGAGGGGDAFAQRGHPVRAGQTEGLDAQSVRHVRATLRRSLADAVRDGLLDRNVGGLAKPPALDAHRERSILDAAQARLLIESTRGTRYGPLWTILVTTGLRISEALGLAWSDVDMGGNDEPLGSAVRHSGGPDGLRRMDARPSRGVRSGAGEGQRGPSLTVRHQLAREDGEWVRRPPKTAKGRRTIPLTLLGVDALRAQREQQRADRGAFSLDGLVFTTERGRPIHGENLLPKLRADLVAAGLPRVTIHDLRHSCATVLFAAGVPLPVVSRILGHSTVRITMDTYVGRIPELAQEAADKMQEALG